RSAARYSMSSVTPPPVDHAESTVRLSASHHFCIFVGHPLGLSFLPLAPFEQEVRERRRAEANQDPPRQIAVPGIIIFVASLFLLGDLDDILFPEFLPVDALGPLLA